MRTLVFGSSWMTHSPEWRIYYDDESFFDANDGAWEEAPLDGVICVVRQHEGRTEFISGGDHYVRFEDGTIAAIELEPFLRGPFLVPGVIKFGRMTSHRRHEKIMARARAEFLGR